MALREGRCRNCGSIIRVLDDRPTQRCIFCWAETPTQEALDLMNVGPDYEFPNEEIEAPSHEDRSAAMMQQLGMTGQAAQNVIQRSSRPTRQVEPKDKLSAVERVKAMAKSNKIVKVPKVSLKQSLTMVIAGVLLVGLFLLFTLPGYSKYKVRAEEMDQLLQEKLEERVNPESHLSYGRRDFSTATLLFEEETLSEDDVRDIAERYAMARASLLDQADDPYQDPIKLQIYSDGAAYRLHIDKDGEITIDDVPLYAKPPVPVEATSEEAADEVGAEAAKDAAEAEEAAEADAAEEAGDEKQDEAEADAPAGNGEATPEAKDEA